MYGFVAGSVSGPEDVECCSMGSSDVLRLLPRSPTFVS